jgi:hypothetical protein
LGGQPAGRYVQPIEESHQPSPIAVFMGCARLLLTSVGCSSRIPPSHRPPSPSL